MVTTSPKLLLAGALFGMLGFAVVLRYGTVYIGIGYLTALITAFIVFGLWWVWNSDPTATSAQAVRTLVRMFWTATVTLAGIALAAWLYYSASIFWLLPLPFFFPALACTLFYERIFRRVGKLPFWRKGL